MAKLFGMSTEGLVARFEALTERERNLVLFSALFILVVVVGGGSYLLIEGGINKRNQIATLERQIGEIGNNRARYADAKARQDQEARKFRTNTVSLFSLVQGAAARYGLTVYDLNEKKAGASGSRLLESNVSLSLKQVSIDRLTAFMESVEDSTPGGVVKIIQLNVKQRSDTPDLLDAQMTVATWKSA